LRSRNAAKKANTQSESHGTETDWGFDGFLWQIGPCVRTANAGAQKWTSKEIDALQAQRGS
jgi:hypothetical protein